MCRTGIVASLVILLASCCATAPPEWRDLFDGETLGQWRDSEFFDSEKSSVEDGLLIIPPGSLSAGVTWTGEFPRNGFEISLEAMRVEGYDFFCGLTFPYDEKHASLIVGGWGGVVCGISCLDGWDAGTDINPSHSIRDFDNGVWYKIRLRATPGRIEAWIDDEVIVDVSTVGVDVDIRLDIAESTPLGLAAYQSKAAMRNIRWRPVP